MRSDPWNVEQDGLCALPIRVLAPIDWWCDDANARVGIRMAGAGRVSWMNRRVAPILGAIEDGVTLAALVEAGAKAAAPGRSRASIARSARALVNGLAAQGNLRVELPEPPAVFAHRFVVERELGRGGVGVAWLCRDRDRGDLVVVKHAWNWSGPLAERDERLRAESDVLAAVEHPGVVRLRSRFDIEGRHHLVRAFVDGEDLARPALRNAPLEATRRDRALRQVAAVLRHMHARELLCLDVNPSNFMLTPDGQVMLFDAGHARALGAPLRGGRWGMEGFAAPDLARGGAAYSERADVYGLGALALFLGSGRKPRDGTFEERDLDALTEAECRLVRACVRPAAADRPASIEQAITLLD